MQRAFLRKRYCDSNNRIYSPPTALCLILTLTLTLKFPSHPFVFSPSSWMDKSAKAAHTSAKKSTPKSPPPKKSPRTSSKSGSRRSVSSTTKRLSDVVPGANVTVQKKVEERKPEAAKASTSSSGNFLDLNFGETPAPATKTAAPAPAPAASANDDGWADDWSFGGAPGDTAFAAARASNPNPNPNPNPNR